LESFQGQWMRPHIFRRQYADNRRRCYKEASVVKGHEKYEVILDGISLKTPGGKIVAFTSEPLALAVAAEWEAQKEEVLLSSMHLTSLSYTSIDNPNKRQRDGFSYEIAKFLETDTILFHSQDEELYKLQRTEWQPVIDWFNDEFKVNMKPTRGLVVPQLDNATRTNILKHLLTYNLECLNGISFAAESLHSLIITLCCLRSQLTVEQAVLLSRLEEEFQTGNWGRVEWAHDLNQSDLQSRVSAGILYTKLTQESETHNEKFDRVFHRQILVTPEFKKHTFNLVSLKLVSFFTIMCLATMMVPGKNK